MCNGQTTRHENMPGHPRDKKKLELLDTSLPEGFKMVRLNDDAVKNYGKTDGGETLILRRYLKPEHDSRTKV